MLFALRDEVRQSVPKYLNDLFRQIQALDALNQCLDLRTGLPPLRGMAASPDFLLLLAQHLKKTKPSVVIECGSGATTVVIARCLQLNGMGHLFSIENDQEFAQITAEKLESLGLSDCVTIIYAPLIPTVIEGEEWSWYDLKDLPLPLSIDCLIVDGPPYWVGSLARYPAGPSLFPYLNSSAVVFLDDAVREEECAIVEQWQKKYPDLVVKSHDCEKGCVTLQKKQIAT